MQRLCALPQGLVAETMCSHSSYDNGHAQITDGRAGQDLCEARETHERRSDPAGRTNKLAIDLHGSISAYLVVIHSVQKKVLVRGHFLPQCPHRVPQHTLFPRHRVHPHTQDDLVFPATLPSSED